MKSGKYTVDRFEGAQAVLLYQPDETIEVNLEKSFLPEETQEGDILLLEFSEQDELLSVVRLLEETQKARQRARDLMEKFRRKNKSF